MSGKPMKRNSETDWDRVDRMDDASIDTSDVSPLEDSFFLRATLREPHPTMEFTLKIDPELLAWFKSQGGAWEQRVNAALRSYAESEKSKVPPAA